MAVEPNPWENKKLLFNSNGIHSVWNFVLFLNVHNTLFLGIGL